MRPHPDRSMTLCNRKWFLSFWFVATRKCFTDNTCNKESDKMFVKRRLALLILAITIHEGTFQLIQLWIMRQGFVACYTNGLNCISSVTCLFSVIQWRRQGLCQLFRVNTFAVSSPPVLSLKFIVLFLFMHNTRSYSVLQSQHTWHHDTTTNTQLKAPLKVKHPYPQIVYFAWWMMATIHSTVPF